MSASQVSAPGTWLADRCARAGLPVVLGQALSMQAIPGGKATHETIEAQQLAGWRRGGRRPPAAGSPAARRAPRALLRRRRPRTRTRAARLAPSHQTNRPDHRPEIGPKRASTVHRDGVAARVPAPAVHTRLAGDVAPMGHSDRRRTALERDRGQPATAPEAQTCSRWRASPGVGQLLARVRRDDIHAIRRVPRGQAFGSSGRLGTWAPASAGPREGTSGQMLGHASLPWAFSDAAGRFVRHHPAGPQSLARVETPHHRGTAFPGLAHPWAGAVDDLVTRETAVALDTGVHA